MSRKNGSIVALLIQCPWWVSVLLSAIAFVFLKYILATIDFGSVTANAFAKGISGAAPFVALVLLLPAPISVLRSWQKSKRLDSQKGIDSIRALGWRELEELVGEAYRRQGYSIAENARGGPDEGIDLVLKKDRITVLVQCKQWRSVKVGVNIVREMYGVMTAKKADGAIVITSGLFTQEAKSFAADKPIDLLDGGQLFQLVRGVQKGPGVPLTATSSKLCPKCGAEMVLRTAQRGSRPGEKFWGCSNFARCRFTQPYET